MGKSKPTIVTVEVFRALYMGKGANTNQSRAVRSEHLKPFVFWARKQGLKKLSVGDWHETLDKFLQLPA